MWCTRRRYVTAGVVTQRPQGVTTAASVAQHRPGDGGSFKWRPRLPGRALPLEASSSGPGPSFRDTRLQLSVRETHQLAGPRHVEDHNWDSVHSCTLLGAPQ